MPRPIRILVAKPGLDGHDRGAKIIARALRDAGMEVIYTGLRQTPEMIVNAALQEDVQVIGLHPFGAYNAIVPHVQNCSAKRNVGSQVCGWIGAEERRRRPENAWGAAPFQHRHRAAPVVCL
jgi:methylmalonyl-CoA mutase C-terminal domain/subunit